LSSARAFLKFPAEVQQKKGSDAGIAEERIL